MLLSTAFRNAAALVRPGPTVQAFNPMALAGSAAVPLIDPGRPWLNSFRGTSDTIRLMVEYARGPEGEQSARVRQWAEAIVRLIQPKDYLSEILALRGWATGPHLRYTNDARHVEQVKTPLRILREIETHGTSLVDCDDLSCLLGSLALTLGRNAGYVMAGFSATDPQYTHVFVRVQEPRSSTWIVCDPVAGTREQEMLNSARRFQTISLDE